MPSPDKIVKISNKELSSSTLLDLIPDAIVVVNQEGYIVFLNQETEVLFQYKKKELIGQLINILIPNNYHKRHNQHIASYFTDPKKRVMGLDLKLCALKKNQEVFPVDISLNPILVDNTMLTLASIRDITARKQLEAELEKIYQDAIKIENENWHMIETSRIKTILLNDVSHRLRTPLNHIIGYIEILKEELATVIKHDQIVFLNKIVHSSQELAILISRLLNVSNEKIDKIDLKIEEINLPNLINKLLKQTKSIADKKHITLITELSPEITLVKTDAFHFKQILYNYLSNAIFFTPEKGKIIVRLYKTSTSSFCIEVEDSGRGIAEKELNKLFTDFQCIDVNNIHNEQQSAYRNLAETKTIVEALNGKVGVTSTLGKGSLFYAILPIEVVPHCH